MLERCYSRDTPYPNTYLRLGSSVSETLDKDIPSEHEQKVLCEKLKQLGAAVVKDESSMAFGAKRLQAGNQQE